MKKTTNKNNKTNNLVKRSNWLTHENAIEQGYASTVFGWISATLESKSFKSASEYASISGKLSTTHKASTIRQYVSALTAGMKKYGAVTVNAKTGEVSGGLIDAYNNKANMAYLDITSLRTFIAGSGQRKAGNTKSFSATKVVKALRKQYTPAQLKSIKAML